MNFIDNIEKITASNHAYVLEHAEDITIVLTDLMTPVTLCKTHGCNLDVCGIPISAQMLNMMTEDQLRATLMVAVNTLSELFLALDRAAKDAGKQ